MGSSSSTYPHSRQKTKVCTVVIRNLLFADNATVAIPTNDFLQGLINCFLNNSKDFSLTIHPKRLLCLDKMLKFSFPPGSLTMS